MKLLPLSSLALLCGTLCVSAASLPESAKIDTLLVQEWQKNNLKPNPPATDAVLVRRLYLDIAGRIPTSHETEEFIQSRDPQKRTKLIDKLLGSDGYTSHMFNYFADVLRLTDNTKGRVTAEAYAEYVKKALKDNTPYDKFVKDLITTQGGVWDSGAIGFYQRDENPLDHLAYTVQVFLGTSIVCAQCHDHPFDKWSQLDYYGMAGFTYGMDTRGGAYRFLNNNNGPAGKRPSKEERMKMTPAERQKAMAEFQGGKGKGNGNRQELAQIRDIMKDVLKPLRYTDVNFNATKLPALPADYKYPNAKPGDKITPKVMFGHDVTVTEGEGKLGAFADWMASPDNPRFTTVIANRMWKKAFGLGLIEPVDEMMDSTVPSNNELMIYLTQLMVDKKYSIKSFLRVLYNTDAYQRMATTTEVGLGETYHFTGPLLRRMSAEQVWDSMVTLNRGDVDAEVSEDNKRLDEYLGDLKMLMDTLKEKGAEGLIDAAKTGAVKRAENDAKIAQIRAQAEAAAGKARDGSAQKVLKQTQQLRREEANDLLQNILGEERAAGLKLGYNRQRNQQKPMVGKGALASLSKEERKEAIRVSTNLNLTERASELPSPAKPGHFLRTFGQSDREMIENASDDATVPQALTMLNGPISEVVNNPASRLSVDLAAAKTMPEKMNILYLSLLSRLPTSEERAVLDQVAAERGNKALDDVTHALLAGTQFLYIQ